MKKVRDWEKKNMIVDYTYKMGFLNILGISCNVDIKDQWGYHYGQHEDSTTEESAGFISEGKVLDTLADAEGHNGQDLVGHKNHYTHS